MDVNSEDKCVSWVCFDSLTNEKLGGRYRWAGAWREWEPKLSARGWEWWEGIPKWREEERIIYTWDRRKAHAQTSGGYPGEGVDDENEDKIHRRAKCKTVSDSLNYAAITLLPELFGNTN